MFFFFFFSSRRRHTTSLRDWSSDVCSSDLPIREGPIREGPIREGPIREGPIREGPIREGPIREGPIREGPIRLGGGLTRQKEVGRFDEGHREDGCAVPRCSRFEMSRCASEVSSRSTACRSIWKKAKSSG